MPSVIYLDIELSDHAGSIASYLIPYSGGAVLVDPDPGFTQVNLKSGLAANGLKLSQVTHVLLTHVHLDNAGAAGWLVGYGAQIYVNPEGAPHMANPERLIASAQ